MHPGSVNSTISRTHSHLRSPSTAGRLMRSTMQKTASATSTTASTMTATMAPGGSCSCAAARIRRHGSLLASPAARNPSAGAGRSRAGRVPVRRARTAVLSSGHDGRPLPAASRVPHHRQRPAQGPPCRRTSAQARHGRVGQRPEHRRGRRRARRRRGPPGRRHQPGPHARDAAAARPQRPQVEGQGAAGGGGVPAGPDAGHVRGGRGRDDGGLGRPVQGGQEDGRGARVRPAQEVRDGRVGRGACPGANACR